ncbi:transcriptional regulator [Rhodococcus erythropolis]|uniref:transcriptional regulator n=1 Tax=Rhodococcus erythropolis group TaxID=2840174 RepID=UPI0021120207|nr:MULTISPECIES: transcriptional regulator [Rhodococcus erythropolis group]MDV6278549.1 transcriptional regulator [Rhodococcus erythropolis]UUE28379.1 transcriptional regulator [Rhodococcus qingshengii]
MKHPAAGLDDLVHQRARLGILAIVSDVDAAEFIYIRDALELTSGNLSAHLKVLSEAGIVRVRKDPVLAGRNAKTWVSITGRGRELLEKEILALKELVRQVEGTLG